MLSPSGTNLMNNKRIVIIKNFATPIACRITQFTYVMFSSIAVYGSFDLFPGLVGVGPESGPKLRGGNFPQVRLEVLVLQQADYAFPGSGPSGKNP